MSEQQPSPIAAERQRFIALVQSAMRKTQAKQQLTPQETRAWAKWEAEEDERRGRRWLASLSKKKYCEIVGRQQKVVNDQAELYGVPLRGAEINALEVLRWMHDFFSTHRHSLPGIVRGEEASDTPRDMLIREQIEVYRRRVQLLENKIDVEANTLLPRGEVHELLAQLANILRGAGEKLEKQHGKQAASILTVALDNFAAVLMQLEPKTGESVTDSGDGTPGSDRRNPLVAAPLTSSDDSPDPPVGRGGNRRSGGKARRNKIPE